MKENDLRKAFKQSNGVELTKNTEKRSQSIPMTIRATDWEEVINISSKITEEMKTHKTSTRATIKEFTITCKDMLEVSLRRNTPKTQRCTELPLGVGEIEEQEHIAL